MLDSLQTHRINTPKVADFDSSREIVMAQDKRGSVRLTENIVKKTLPGLAVVRVFDSMVPGFHLRVTPAGSKDFAIVFQRPGGKKVHATIGSANVWTVEDPKGEDGKPLLDKDGKPKRGARSMAEELRKKHDEGQDARAYLQAERNAKDIAALVKVWEEDYKRLLKPSTQSSHASIIKCNILPAFGSRLVKDLDRESIKAWYRKESKIHPTGANRTLEVLSKLMSIAEEEGWKPLQTNPCYKFPKVTLRPCKRVLTADELRRLESSMVGLEASGKLDKIAADMVRFLALSGLRTGEAGNLKWADIDMDRNTMTIRDHKTSAKVGPKVLPLNASLRAILKRRAGAKLGKLVFPGLVQDRPIQGLLKMWRRVLDVDGCNLGEATPHDLRRTFMSVSVELGYPPAIGDTLLGHSLGQIRDTYMQMSMEGILATASEDAAQWIASAMQGAAPKPGSKVVAEQDAKAMA